MHSQGLVVIDAEAFCSCVAEMQEVHEQAIYLAQNLEVQNLVRGCSFYIGLRGCLPKGTPSFETRCKLLLSMAV